MTTKNMTRTSDVDLSPIIGAMRNCRGSSFVASSSIPTGMLGIKLSAPGGRVTHAIDRDRLQSVKAHVSEMIQKGEISPVAGRTIHKDTPYEKHIPVYPDWVERLLYRS